MPTKTKKTLKAIKYAGKTYTGNLEKWKNGTWYVTRTDQGKRLGWRKITGNKTKDAHNINKLNAQPTFEYWKGITEKRAKQPTIQLKKIAETVSGKPNVKDLTNQIDNTKTIKFGTEGIRTHGIINLTKAKQIYKKILQPKLIDQSKIDQVINNREKTLKNRMSLTITLYTEHGQKATITIAGILLEQEKDAYQYWMGAYIESNKFKEMAEEFKQLIGNPKQYIPKELNPTPGTVNNITAEWTIA